MLVVLNKCGDLGGSLCMHVCCMCWVRVGVGFACWNGGRRGGKGGVGCALLIYCCDGCVCVVVPTTAWLPPSLSHGTSHVRAGVLGMVHAAHAAAHSQVLPITHLTALNTHVQTVLDEAATQHSSGVAHSSGGVLLPRQAAASGCQLRAQDHIGVSAFAFQGTNAHVLLSPAAEVSLGSVGCQRAGFQMSKWFILGERQWPACRECAASSQ